MAKFQMTELVSELAPFTARIGAGTGAANHLSDEEVGKAFKLGADSRYVLCVAGDPIEGFLQSVESATLDNYSVGSIKYAGRKTVIADGLEATAGTGTIAVGDYVVAGTMVAKDTGLGTSYQKVCKATNQPGAAITVAADANDDGVEATAAFALMADQLMNAKFGWRVVSILAGGTGAVGDTLVIERV